MIPASPIRTLASLAKPTNQGAARVTVARADGTLRLETERGAAFVRYAIADEGAEPILPVSVAARGLRALLTGAASVSFRAHHDGLSVETDRAVGHLSGGSALDMEAMDDDDDGDKMTAADVASLAWVARATASHAHRYGLSGVHVEPGAVVATDGHRIHFAPVSGLPVLPTMRLLPGEIVALVTRLCASGCSVWTDDRRVYARGGGWAIRQRMAEGEFPNWRAVVPKEWPTLVTFNAPGLHDAVKAVHSVSVMHRDKQMVLAPHGPDATFTGSHTDGGVRVTSRVPMLAGRVDRIGLSSAFVLDALAGASGKVDMHFAHPVSPVQVARDDGRMAILMPIGLD